MISSCPGRELLAAPLTAPRVDYSIACEYTLPMVSMPSGYKRESHPPQSCFDLDLRDDCVSMEETEIGCLSFLMGLRDST
jgi:hypothetical protein